MEISALPSSSSKSFATLKEVRTTYKDFFNSSGAQL
jgi:hypothetical protein